ncbi:hypothetical protein C8Q74DRAFT_3484 [Fomes fomentarius]|nr:hypothetical protein C8Q74DRAFT_3484 [Fomes fomentarius]
MDALNELEGYACPQMQMNPLSILLLYTSHCIVIARRPGKVTTRTLCEYNVSPSIHFCTLLRSCFSSLGEHGSLTPPMSVATRIPLDLMRDVASWLETSDLLAMLMTSTLTNKALTPTLYSTVDLRSWDGLLRCLATLALLPEDHAFHRDLAIFVRTLVIQRPRSRRPFYATDYALSLSMAVARMTNLRYFSSKIGLTPCSLDILFKLVSGTCPRIQTIDIIVSDELTTKLDIRNFRVPSTLRELRLVLSDQPCPVRNPFVRKLLAASGPSLRSLAPRTDGHYNAPFWQEILPWDLDFANLEDLVIGGSALYQPCFQSATQVRTLKVTNMWKVTSDVHFAAFPDLEDLSCPWEMIPHFLVDDPEYRRPIKTIHIDDVSCERRGTSPRDPESGPTY